MYSEVSWPHQSFKAIWIAESLAGKKASRTQQFSMSWIVRSSFAHPLQQKRWKMASILSRNLSQKDSVLLFEPSATAPGPKVSRGRRSSRHWGKTIHVVRDHT